MMYMELKQEIIKWLMENPNTWNRHNACTEAFREYIFNSEGNYLIGGENVSNFITAAEKLIYGDNKMVEKLSEVSNY